MGKKALIASFGMTEEHLRGKSQEEMADLVMDRIESVRGYSPDLICLPEIYLKNGGDCDNPNWAEITADSLRRLQKAAAEMACYICACLYEPSRNFADRKYNCTVLIDRCGNIVGRYRKRHTTEGESSEVLGVIPGSELPVFDTDFGRIAFQTCFDIGWREAWKRLADAGAQLVVWSAAYNGGNLLNAYAALNMYYVVSTVRTEHAQIIDMTGRAIAEGSRWNGLAMAKVDLETTLFHIDEQWRKIDEIRLELGDKVTIRSYSDENVFTIESNDPEWPMARIQADFGLVSYKEYHQRAERVQETWRKMYREDL